MAAPATPAPMYESSCAVWICPDSAVAWARCPDLQLGASAIPVDVRIAANGNAVVVTAQIAVGGVSQVKTLVCQWGACDWQPVSTPPGAHEGVDVDVRGGAAVMALSVSGSLKLFSLDLSSPTPSWTQEAGAWPDGSFNSDNTCTAESPEMARGELGSWITWGERCGASPWQVMLRRMD